MRPFEIVSAVLIAIYIFYALLGRPQTTITKIIPFAALAFLLLHLFLEKYRWQMIPLYILAAALCVMVLFIKSNPPRWLTIPALIVLIPAVGLPILLPIPNVTKPDGPYQVGTMTFTLTDNSRREIYSSNPDIPRRFLIQVWYPASPRATDKTAPWMPNASIYAPAISGMLKLPSFFLDHLELVTTPAFQDAPVAHSNTAYPVLVFSHGWKGFRAQNTVQMLNLASHGYVVIGMEHTYGAVTTVFPDGTIAPNNPAALPTGLPDDVYFPIARELADQWSRDIGYALDFMSQQNADSQSPFYNSLDLNEVGVFGHSTGGGATIQFCGTDPRCKAGFAEDPYMTPVSEQVMTKGVSQPFFFMFSETWTGDTKAENTNNNLFRQFYPNASQSFGAVMIKGSAHYDFSDLPMLTPLAPQLRLKGPISGPLVIKIVNNYLLTFFDKTLKGQSTTLFDGASPYPEVVPFK
jgi:predicted dienelactone hydrolase